MTTKTRPLLAAFAVLLAAAPLVPAQDGLGLPLVPPPLDGVRLDEMVAMPAVLSVSVPKEEVSWREHLELVAPWFERATRGRTQLDLGRHEAPSLRVVRDPSLAPEEYRITVASDGVELEVATRRGLCRSTAALLQLLGSSEDGTLSTLVLHNRPTCSYRSSLIDLGRNPHSATLLEETLDLLWYYGLESLHLHLTDDQRFAIPSTRFPKLWDGTISREEFQALDRAAALRGIELVPELEVPGHSSLLRHHYPGVFGQSPTELATSETAFAGITALIDETLALLPSTRRFHVGADEAYGVPDEAQRALTARLHRYLESRGIETVAWEGPGPGTGEDRIPKDVILIEWQMTSYLADRMLADGHRVVNASWDPLYLVDHYPRTNFTMAAPQRIYERLQRHRFQNFDPGLPTFLHPLVVEPSERLIGFCMPWWEGREEHFFPMVLPRLVPFAEVAFDPDRPRNFADFEERARETERTRNRVFHPVAIGAAALAVPSDGVFHGRTRVSLEVEPFLRVPNSEIRFTRDGSEPTENSPRYETPFDLDQSAVVRAALFVGGERRGHGSRRTLTRVDPIRNLALGKPVTASVPSGAPFSKERLTDGGTANLDFFLAYPAAPDPVIVTVDLENVSSVDRIVVHSYSISGSFEKVEVRVSADGTTFDPVGARLERPQDPTAPVTFAFPARPVRFVRVSSHGNEGYVFDSFSKLTEIQVFGPGGGDEGPSPDPDRTSDVR